MIHLELLGASTLLRLSESLENEYIPLDLTFEPEMNLNSAIFSAFISDGDFLSSSAIREPPNALRKLFLSGVAN